MVKECSGDGDVRAKLDTNFSPSCGCEHVQLRTDNSAIQTIIAWTYLSGEHKQSDEEDKEGDRAHSLQVFENPWSWRQWRKKECVRMEIEREKEEKESEKEEVDEKEKSRCY